MIADFASLCKQTARNVRRFSETAGRARGGCAKGTRGGYHLCI